MPSQIEIAIATIKMPIFDCTHQIERRRSRRETVDESSQARFGAVLTC